MTRILRCRTTILALLFLISAPLYAAADNASAPWSTPHSSSVNPAATPGYMTTSDFEVVMEINRMRTDPAGYAKKYLIPRRLYYRGNSYTIPGKITIIANEGVSALDECIRELLNSTPVSSLTPSKGLTLAARDQVNDQASTGKTGHAGSDGSTMQTRIERYGQWKMSAAENISYGPVEAREIVISLLIDDGVPSRGHRKNLLNGSLNVVGVKTGTHPVYGAMCVMDFAGNYIQKQK